MRIPPPDTYVPETRIEHIQGFLRAVEAIGSFVNHGLCLDFGELPLAASTEAALDAYYRQRQGLAAMMIRLTLEPGGVLQVAERSR